MSQRERLMGKAAKMEVLSSFFTHRLPGSVVRSIDVCPNTPPPPLPLTAGPLLTGPQLSLAVYSSMGVVVGTEDSGGSGEQK